MTGEEKAKVKAKEAAPEAGAASDQNRAVPKVHWDDSEMTTCYANVVNAAATHEEVTVFFGTNQTWNVRSENEVTIKLSDRVILNPLAAKRLFLLLGGVLKDYESRYGTLEVKGSDKSGV